MARINCMKSNAECCKQGKLDGQRALGGDNSKFLDDDGLGELDGEGVREVENATMAIEYMNSTAIGCAEWMPRDWGDSMEVWQRLPLGQLHRLS